MSDPVCWDASTSIDMLDCVLLQMQSFDADDKLWALASQVGPPLPGGHWPHSWCTWGAVYSGPCLTARDAAKTAAKMLHAEDVARMASSVAQCCRSSHAGCQEIAGPHCLQDGTPAPGQDLPPWRQQWQQQRPTDWRQHQAREAGGATQGPTPHPMQDSFVTGRSHDQQQHDLLAEAEQALTSSESWSQRLWGSPDERDQELRMQVGGAQVHVAACGPLLCLTDTGSKTADGMRQLGPLPELCGRLGKPLDLVERPLLGSVEEHCWELNRFMPVPRGSVGRRSACRCTAEC